MKFEIGNEIENQEPFYLDIANVITGRTFVASITRFGKSWKARKIVEECFGHAGIIIIDPEGEYISLREKFSLLIIGRDIPLQLETAEFMADKILEAKVSVIIDLSTTEEELGKEYVDKLLKRFFFLQTTARIPYLIVVEEAEDFIPEKGIATATCIDVFRNIAKKGGKRGIGLMVIAHRPAWVSKGVLSQCANKAIGRMDWPSDLAVIEEYLRIPHKTIEKLPILGKGEFFLAGDWVEKPVFVKVGAVKTTHLGYTPNVIPPSPKELQAVIASLQKALPEIIEKIKPTVVPIDEIKSKLKAELEGKYKDRIESIQRTAEEKAERKLKARIDELQELNEKLSRSQALQPTSPIANVLDHPIVRTRMLELSDKARDLLTRIEREPGLTREQLAAFLTTSTNSIASTVETINRIFHATAIIGEGKPLRYKSMLKRLFITDVGKREIEELQRLQATNQNQQKAITDLEDKCRGLMTQISEASALKKQVSMLNLSLEQDKLMIVELKAKNDKLIQEAEMGKAGRSLQIALKSMVDEALKDEPSTHVDIDKKIADALSKLNIPLKIPESTIYGDHPTILTGSTDITLEQKVASFTLQRNHENLTVSTNDLQGRILHLVIKGFFDSRHNRKEVVIELSNNGWIHEDREVDSALLDLCSKGVFARKISTGNIFWYNLQPEAKELIHR